MNSKNIFMRRILLGLPLIGIWFLPSISNAQIRCLIKTDTARQRVVSETRPAEPLKGKAAKLWEPDTVKIDPELQHLYCQSKTIPAVRSGSEVDTVTLTPDPGGVIDWSSVEPPLADSVITLETPLPFACRMVRIEDHTEVAAEQAIPETEVWDGTVPLSYLPCRNPWSVLMDCSGSVPDSSVSLPATSFTEYQDAEDTTGDQGIVTSKKNEAAAKDSPFGLRFVIHRKPAMQSESSESIVTASILESDSLEASPGNLRTASINNGFGVLQRDDIDAEAITTMPISVPDTLCPGCWYIIHMHMIYISDQEEGNVVSESTEAVENAKIEPVAPEATPIVKEEPGIR